MVYDGWGDQIMTEALLEKLRSLPAERVAEVEDFVGFIRSRHIDRALVTAAAETRAPRLSR